MSQTLEDVRATALRLPLSERAELVHDLMTSLAADEFDLDFDAALAAEIDARSEAYQRGEANAIDWRESVERVGKALEAQRTGA